MEARSAAQEHDAARPAAVVAEHINDNCCSVSLTGAAPSQQMGDRGDDADRPENRSENTWENDEEVAGDVVPQVHEHRDGSWR